MEWEIVDRDQSDAAALEATAVDLILAALISWTPQKGTPFHMQERHFARTPP
jgi:hypothetical protein